MENNILYSKISPMDIFKVLSYCFLCFTCGYIVGNGQREKIVDRKQFDLIMDTVGEKTGSPCPEAMKILIWGKFQDWDALAFAKFIRHEINNPENTDKHVTS